MNDFNMMDHLESQDDTRFNMEAEVERDTTTIDDDGLDFDTLGSVESSLITRAGSECSVEESCTLGEAPAAGTKLKVVTLNDPLNLRSVDNIDNVIGSIPRNRSDLDLESMGESRNFMMGEDGKVDVYLKVKYNGTEGYAHAGYLDLVETESGDEPEADSDVVDNGELDGLSVEDLSSRGQAALESQNWEEAHSIYDRLAELDADNPDHRFKQAVSLGRLERYEDALEAIDVAISLDSDNPVYHNNRGVYLHRLGRNDEAVEAIRRVLELDEDYPRAQEKLDQYTSELEDAPSVEELTERADELREAEDYEAAAPLYIRLTELESTTTRHFKLAAFCLARLERYEEALRFIDQAIVLDSNDASFHNNRGFYLYHLGRIEDAIVALERALEIDPDYERAQEKLDIYRAELEAESGEGSSSDGSGTPDFWGY